MEKALLFDLGNTLVHYFERHEFQDILKQSISDVHSFLASRSIYRELSRQTWERVKLEDYESPNHRVRPLEGRLKRIFQLEELESSDEFMMEICKCFLGPIFSRARCYEETCSTLEAIVSQGFKVALISNTPWGSPAMPWREHLKDLKLSEYFDIIVFCRDVGWRKPASQIFEFALHQLQIAPKNCFFIGDDPRWDVMGPKSIGITPILIDRVGDEVTTKNIALKDVKRITNLEDLLSLL